MSEFPLADPNDPRVPVVLDILKKSKFMGGTFTLDSRRILAALDAWEAAGRPPRDVKDFPAANYRPPTPTDA